MAFCFRKKESVSKAVRRLGRGRIEDALGCLEDCGRAEAIHCARKDIKKVRAVLGLVRTQIPKKDCRRITNRLRKAAKDLAAPRDAYVLARTLRKLTQHFKGRLAPAALREVRSRYDRDYDEAMKDFGKRKTVKSIERTLRQTAKEVDRLKVNGKGWKALCPGVKQAYTEGQQAYETVLKDPAAENFHQWRKHAKDLWYQVSLLRPLWPEQMDAMAHELETLSEYVGEDHDLAMLSQTVEDKRARRADRPEWEILKRLIEERQRELRASALALGSRFYAEKPSAFCDRLAGYWQIWRGEQKPRLAGLKANA